MNDNSGCLDNAPHQSSPIIDRRLIAMLLLCFLFAASFLLSISSPAGFWEKIKTIFRPIVKYVLLVLPCFRFHVIIKKNK